MISATLGLGKVLEEGGAAKTAWKQVKQWLIDTPFVSAANSTPRMGKDGAPTRGECSQSSPVPHDVRADQNLPLASQLQTALRPLRSAGPIPAASTKGEPIQVFGSMIRASALHLSRRYN